MNYKAVLFDFDYTLADATEAILEGFWYAFDQMGLPRPDREAIRLTVGYMLEDEFTMLSGDARPEKRAEFHRYYSEKAAPMQVEATRMCSGAAELLRALHAAGIPTGVVSSKRGAVLKAVIEAHGLAHLLCSITGGDTVTRPKPDPEGVATAISSLGLRPEQVLYCGDTVIDAETAQRGGVPFCAVLNGTTGAAAFSPYPHVHIAPDLMDLKRWLAL